jgi:hypothetical protein
MASNSAKAATIAKAVTVIKAATIMMRLVLSFMPLTAHSSAMFIATP